MKLVSRWGFFSHGGHICKPMFISVIVTQVVLPEIYGGFVWREASGDTAKALAPDILEQKLRSGKI